MPQVSREFIEDALQSRYDEVEDRWGNEGTELFWESFLELVVENGVGKDDTPSIIVDNYLINSDCAQWEEYRKGDETFEDVVKRLDPLFYDEDSGWIMVSA